MSKQNTSQFSPAILINHLNVDPENQETLLSILKEGAESIMPKHAGYLGSTIYKSKDSKSIIVISHWSRPKDIEAVRNNPENSDYLKKIQAIAKATPGLFESFFVHEIK